MLVEWDMSREPFNSMVKDGTAGPAIEKAIGAIQPEVCYFAARDGKRGGTMVVDLEDASNIPPSRNTCFSPSTPMCDFFRA